MMSRTAIYIFLTVCCLSFYSFVIGADFEVTPRGNTLWALSHDVAVSGDHAFYVMSYGLEVYNVLNPSNRVLVSRLLLPGDPKDIYIQGAYAYILNYGGQLLIVNISNPSAPEYVSACQLADRGLSNVYVSGDFAYVTHEESGMLIIDVGNPNSPTQVGVIALPGYVRGLFVENDLAYVTSVESGLHIIDVSDRSSPHQIGYFGGIGSYNGPAYIDVVVSGDYAFVADYAYSVINDSGGFQVIDVSNPTTPQFVTLRDIHLLTDILGYGNTIYVSTQTNGLWSFDVTDPTNPVLLDHNEESLYLHDIAVHSQHIFSTSRQDEIYNISDPTSISLTSINPYKHEIWDVALYGNLAYLAQSQSGVTIVDISDPDYPEPVTVIPFGRVHSVETVGDLLYVSHGTGGGSSLYIYELADPESPQLVGQYVNATDTGQAENFFIDTDRNLAYLVMWPYHLHILDISDPSNPTLQGIYRPGEYADHIPVYSDNAGAHVVTARGNYAYLCNYRDYVHIIDVSDPTAPVHIGRYTGMPYPMAAAINGEQLYVSRLNYDATHILDISNPAEPVFISSLDAGAGYQLTFGDNYLFLPDDELNIADISNDFQPIDIGYFETPGRAWKIEMTGNRMYVADYYGFCIYDVNLPTFKRGDANGDNILNIADAVYLIGYIFGGGPAPEPVDAGDADCTGSVNVADAVFMVNYVFSGGPPPSCGE